MAKIPEETLREWETAAEYLPIEDMFDRDPLRDILLCLIKRVRELEKVLAELVAEEDDR